MARLDDGTRVKIPRGGTEPEDEDRIMELLAYANRKTADKLCKREAMDGNGKRTAISV